MPKKKDNPGDGPIYSEKKIRQLTQYIRNRIAEHISLQVAGKLPFCKRMPVIRIEIRHIMEILNRSRSTASRIMAEIRVKRKKKGNEYISVEDFCAVTGLPQRDVQQALNLLT